MSQITLEDLAHVMDALAEGRIVNEVTVGRDVAEWARVALERMLSIS
jgi:quinolinate synthase